MAQLSLYVDDSTMEDLRRDAAREGKTLSKYAAGVLRERKEHNGWPPGFFNLYEFMLPFEVLPFDSKCAHIYARIRGELEMTGKVIGPNDLLIAATALANSAVLVTNNVDEFKRVPGLSIESWYEMTWEELGMGPLAEPERL